MSQYFHIHPVNPQVRLIAQAVKIIRGGGVVVYPTDSCYAFGCAVGEKEPAERIRRLRQLDPKHDFTLVCRDLAQAATYARIDNAAFRLIRSLTPGPYTFILPATSEVPKRLLNPKRRAIGLRIPDNAVAMALLEALGEPLMSTTLQLPGGDMALSDPQDIFDRIGHEVELVIDGGNCGLEPTTVVEFVGDVPCVVRVGKGDIGPIESS